jgi:hypothetical protein
MSILDALSKHSMFSETLDTLNRDPSTGHQMKGFDFAQNFPGAVPGGINTPTSFLGPMLSKGYQYGQQIGKSILDGPGSYTLGQAIEDAKVQSDANIQGMLGKGFDMDTYNQNVKDFNIADVTFANSFGLDNLFGSSAMANQPTVDVGSVQSAINAARNREALNKAGLMSLDDAGLTTEDYETFAEKAKPGFNKQFAKQLGTTALGLITGNPLIGLIARGLGSLAGRGGLTGVRGGADLRGDTTFNTFRRSTSIVDFMQRQRDKKAREAAARRGEIKQLQKDIDAGKYGGGDKAGGGGFKGEGGYGSSAERGGPGGIHG